MTVRVGATRDGFYVEDDGPGIGEADRETVFEAGYTTTENGTGFGLAIVKQVVEALNWDIAITEGADGGVRVELSNIEFGSAETERTRVPGRPSQS